MTEHALRVFLHLHGSKLPSLRHIVDASTHAGIEGSQTMAEVAEAICRANGASAEQVTIVSGQLEQLSSLPEKQASPCCDAQL